MRKKKIPVYKAFTGLFNESGEELSGFEEEPLWITGRVAFSTSTENYGIERREAIYEIKIYCEKLYPISHRDELSYNGTRWQIITPPERWENNRGYRDALVITARMVEG